MQSPPLFSLPYATKCGLEMAASEAVGRGGVDSPDLTGTSRDVRRCGVVEDLITRSWLDLITASVSSGDASSAAVNPAATKRNDASCARNSQVQTKKPASNCSCCCGMKSWMWWCCY